MIKKLKTPLTDKDIESLRAGDIVLITGTIYTARDAAHQRLAQLIKEGKALPFDAKNAIIYYTGPAPKKPGRVIGPCGPTSSYRMDPYSPTLMKEGVRVMIGKGDRSEEFYKALIDQKSVYLQATGGAATLISESVKNVTLIAYPELGAEAVYKFDVEEFKAIVTNDSVGGNLPKENRKKYQK